MGPCQTADETGDEDGLIFHAVDIDAGCLGCLLELTNRPQPQAPYGLIKNKPHGDHQNDDKPLGDAPVVENVVEHRNIFQKRNMYLGNADDLRVREGTLLPQNGIQKILGQGHCQQVDAHTDGTVVCLVADVADGNDPCHEHTLNMAASTPSIQLPVV